MKEMNDKLIIDTKVVCNERDEHHCVVDVWVHAWSAWFGARPWHVLDFGRVDPPPNITHYLVGYGILYYWVGRRMRAFCM